MSIEKEDFGLRFEEAIRDKEIALLLMDFDKILKESSIPNSLRVLRKLRKY